MTLDDIIRLKEIRNIIKERDKNIVKINAKSKIEIINRYLIERRQYNINIKNNFMLTSSIIFDSIIKDIDHISEVFDSNLSKCLSDLSQVFQKVGILKDKRIEYLRTIVNSIFIEKSHNFGDTKLMFLTITIFISSIIDSSEVISINELYLNIFQYYGLREKDEYFDKIFYNGIRYFSTFWKQVRMFPL